MFRATILFAGIVVAAVPMEFEFELYFTTTILYHVMYTAFMMGQINIGVKDNESIIQTGRVTA